jgi:hypothetical protein
VSRDFAATESTVSLLEPLENGCEWVKQDVLGEGRYVLARLERSCQGGATALSLDGRWGALWFWRGGIGMPAFGRPSFPEPFVTAAFRERLYLVELATGAVQELPPPPLGELAEFGFDWKERLVALTVVRPAPEKPKPAPAGTARKRFPYGDEGSDRPVKAYAFAYENGAWARQEVKEAPGGLALFAQVTGLKLWRELGTRSRAALTAYREGEQVEDDGLLDALLPLIPERDGEWLLYPAGQGQSVVAWSTEFGGGEVVTGLLRLVKDGKPVALPKFPFKVNDVVVPQSRGPFLLISQADSGGHARLYRGARLLWGSDTARAVTFWPKR